MTDTRENIKTQLRNSKGRVVSNKATPTLAITEAIDATVRAIRTKHPDLPTLVLVVGASGKRSNSMVHGHFARDRWEAKGFSHEVLLSGESLKRGPEATLGTILHECAHALAAARELQDTSREGRYHNKRFHALAKEVGIDVSYDKKLGWSETTVPKETIALYKPELAELRKALKAYRRIEPDKPKAAPTTVKLECDCRSVRVPIKFFEEGTIQCTLCGAEFTDPENQEEAA